MNITKERLSEIVREEVAKHRLDEAAILTLPDAVQKIEEEADRVARFLGYGPGAEAVQGEEQFLVKALESLYRIAAELKHHPAYEANDMSEGSTDDEAWKLPKPTEDPMGRQHKTSQLRKGAMRRRRELEKGLPKKKR